MARPTDFSPELAATICLRIAEGESLRKICKDDAMPGKTTVLRWLGQDEHKEFRDQYARARELQADLLADDIIEIADDSADDMRPADGDAGDAGVMVVDHEHIQRSRLRVDARKWAAAKLAPKKYGDRVVTELAGTVGIREAPPQTPDQVRDDLAGIFGATAAAVAADVPPRAAAEPPGNDPVVRPHPDECFGPLSGAFAPGEAEADPQ